MKYDKNTCLLRPLEPGEIIKHGDVYLVDSSGFEPLPNVRAGNAYDSGLHPQYFRPVPITTGWRPLSEAHLIKDEPPFSTIVWRSKYLNYGTAVSYKNDPPPIGCSHFYIIPPCDIPPPDPERERFEKWWATSHTSVANKADALIVWLAARKETK